MPDTVKTRKNVTELENVISKINDNGRIVIPAAIRQRMGLKPGDAVVLTLGNDGVLRVESQLAKIRQVQAEFRRFTETGVLASDELIAERRQQARREEREMEEWLG
jgi:AbrB family looped-hinge helix DNA binding protein